MSTPALATRFGQRVRQLREAKGWSQEELARRAGLHRTHISLIETAKRSVQLDTVERLAAALGLQPSDLFLPAAAAPAPTTKRADRDELERLLPHLREYQALATKHGIDDVFQDNGGKLLQTLILLDLQKLPRREGNDAVDSAGKEYELKTVNIRLTKSFSTHHHLNPTIIKKYREVAAWYFSVYEHIELSKIYRLTPGQLEPYFADWEQAWRKLNKGRKEKKDLNNRKIQLSFVEQHGQLVYPVAKKT